MNCVVCNKLTSHLLELDGEFFPVCFGKCSKIFKEELNYE